MVYLNYHIKKDQYHAYKSARQRNRVVPGQLQGPHASPFLMDPAAQAMMMRMFPFGIPQPNRGFFGKQ
jgi:hypothetical protein